MTETDREREGARALEALAMQPIPEPHADAARIRILWIFAWLVVGGEETEVRLLAKGLDPARYRVDVLPCLRRDVLPAQTQDQLRALGVHVDETA